MPESETVLKGQIEEVIFESETSGYRVLAVSGAENFIAVGYAPAVAPGEMVELTGCFVEHPQYGRQFKFSHCRPLLPDSEDAIYHYLCSGLIKGIGPRTAARLIQQFGARTLEVLRHEPQEVAKIKGIGSRRAERMAAQLAEKLEYQDLMLLLSPHGIGTGLIFRIYRQWGAGAVERIRKNPYDLADEIDGIGFLTADRVARALGLAPDAPARLAGALKYRLLQALYEGNTWLPRTELLTDAARLIHQPEENLIPFLDDLIRKGDVIAFDSLQPLPADDLGPPGATDGDATRHGRRLALPGYFEIEKSAAFLLQRLLRSVPSRFPEWCDAATAQSVIDRTSQDLNLKLAREQNLALQMALREPFSILTGGPGTGKTTIIRVLTECFRREGGKVLLAAPTGRAARRLSELTGCPAKTIHRLLALPLYGSPEPPGLGIDEMTDVTLNCDLLVVDEVSMLDVVLFRSLLEAIPPGTRVLMVGDANQLPAIGPGQVLTDLLQSKAVPAVCLTEIFRQSAQSLIVRNAHQILHGQRLEIDQSFASSFIFVVREPAEAVAQAVIRLYTDILPNQYGLDVKRDVQVLTPAHKGPAGTVALNQALQGPIDEDTALNAHGVWFGPDDKVMQMRNQYELSWTLADGPKDQPVRGKGVFNGEMGRVKAVDPEEDELTVLFDDGREVGYDRAALEDLDLAYAVTIHKSQGSEYPVVILAIPPTAPRLLTRNLLYTGVTRARQKLLLVSSRQTIAAMLANEQTSRRYTTLGEWLQQPPPESLKHPTANGAV
jgi:exodeoxyribonuclease V alpha subunit